jgi:ELWxxDGT repeat protein
MPPRSRPLGLLALLATLLGPTADAGHRPEPGLLIADLAPGAEEHGSWPAGFVAFGDRLLFLAEDPQHGRELWSTDGTPAGTQRVADLCPGPCSGLFSTPVVAGERYFLAVVEAPERRALWVGDDSGLRRVYLFAPGSDAALLHLTALGDRVVFVAADPEHGSEPWVSDGTPEGTRMLADLCRPGCSSHPADLLRVEETVFFSASHDKLGRELFETDGSLEGTRLAADVCPGRCSSVPSPLASWRERAWFTATRPDLGLELWSAAPGAGARLEVDLLPGPESSVPSPQIVWRDRLYLQVVGLAEGIDWYRISEPGEGAQPAVELDLGSRRVHNFTEVDGALHLVESSVTGSRLWVLDDPSTPGRQLASFENGAASPVGAVGGAVVYLHLAPSGELALWRTDGTVGGTRKLRRFEGLPWPRGQVLDGRLLFAADGGGAGPELWAVGADDAPRRLRNLARDASSSDPHHLTAWEDDLGFLALGASELSGSVWRARGREVARLSDEADFFDLERLGDALVAAREGELWRIGGDGERTLLHDGQRPVELTAAGARLFYGTFGTGQELWKSDGTPEGTRLVVDANPEWSDGCPWQLTLISARLSPPPSDDCSAQNTYPQQLTALGHDIAFVVAPHGREEIWLSDGTPEGTVAVANVTSFEEDDPISYEALTAAGDTLFFAGLHYSAETLESTWRLYRWRPGQGVPEAVADVPAVWWAPLRLAAAGDRLVFVRPAPNGAGDVLWAVGAQGPARRVHRVRHSALPAAVRSLEPFGDRVLASVLDLEGGEEPWVSGGRPGTTVPLGDLARGSASSRPTGLAPVGDCGLFAAAGAGGHELWLTGGTPESTRRVANVAHGPRASSPAEITAAGDLVYFTADDGAHGRELFAVERAMVEALCSER